MLDQLNVSYEVFVTSAHKTPERTDRYVSRLGQRGVRVAICGAGAAAHLAGVVAANFAGPVIAVPISATELSGADALLAMVQMPSGVPVATVAIGHSGAANAGVLAAEILSIGEPEIRKSILGLRDQIREEYGEPKVARPASAGAGGGAWVAVVHASPTDEPVMARVKKQLEILEIPYETFVTSPTRTPDRTRTFAQSLQARGVSVVIAGSGASGSLGGAIASYFPGPVISVPLATTALAGVDALLASVQLPTGNPVATVAIGAMGAKNSGILAAQMLAQVDADLAKRLAQHRTDIATQLIKEGDELLEKLPREHRGRTY